MANYAKNLSNHVAPNVSKISTPQTQIIPGREEDMTANSAGGVSFKVNDWTRLTRFLILGSEGGSYYASEKELSVENAKVVTSLLKKDGLRVVSEIVAISDSGRAPKNDMAIFALALAASDDNPAVRKAALDALPKVARIGTHLFHFVSFVKKFRGFGRSLRNALANWYLTQSVDELAYHAVKYQSRDGWSNRDILRLSHAKSDDAALNSVLHWMVKGNDGSEIQSAMIRAAEEIKSASSVKDVVRLISEAGLPREAIPTNWLNEKEVWEALLYAGKYGMPLTALIRNLNKMTSIGLIAPLSDASKYVVSKLGDKQALAKARIHPMQMLIANRIYAQGRGMRGELSWSPLPQITDALDAGFYTTFGNVTPTGKKHVIALDVSGSMAGGSVAGSPLTPREASAAMALILMSVEPEYVCVGFTSGGGRWSTPKKGVDGISVLDISPKMRLNDVIQKVSGLPFGGTDCSLPMVWAEKQGIQADCFSIWTDSETYAGSIHPTQALKSYRNKLSPEARLAVVGMVSNGFSIADPKDAGQLDVVGFDTATPELMSAFFRGEV